MGNAELVRRGDTYSDVSMPSVSGAVSASAGTVSSAGVSLSTGTGAVSGISPLLVVVAMAWVEDDPTSSEGVFSVVSEGTTTLDFVSVTIVVSSVELTGVVLSSPLTTMP